MSSTLIVLIVIVVLVILIAGMYNGLVSLRNRSQEALSDIDVQLKRRYDLIPNLVESVKGYAKKESGVLEAVTAARSNAIAAGAQGLPQKEAAENALTGALRSVFAVSENYPHLKSSANFQQLSGELTDTENKLEAARRFYNANVRDYNTKLQAFPTNVFAGLFHFIKMDLFMLDDAAAKEAPKVSF